MFDEKFEYGIQKVLKHEGGYVNDSIDPGGETNFGISKRSYPTIDIKNLTLDNAKHIYYTDYWLQGGYNRIDAKLLACKVFDAAVNMGIHRANKLLQQACNNLNEGLIVDGIIGKNTINVVNKIDPCELLEEYRNEMYSFYTRLISRKPKLAKYKNGWKKRAYS